MHYLTRYDAHLASLRLEERLRGGIEAKIEVMQEAEAGGGSSYTWLTDALAQLMLARRVMSNRWGGGRGGRKVSEEVAGLPVGPGIGGSRLWTTADHPTIRCCA